MSLKGSKSNACRRAISLSVLTVRDLSVPEMEGAARDVADTASDDCEVGASPREIVPLLSGVHQQPSRAIVERPESRAQHGAIAAAQDACIVEAVLLEYGSRAGPREPVGRAAFISWVGEKQCFGGDPLHRHPVDHRDGRGWRRRRLEVVGPGVPEEIMALLKQMEEQELVERHVGLLDPVIAGEDHIAVQPRDLVAAIGEALQREIEEALFLPHDVPPMKLDNDIGVIVAKLKGAVERELHRHQWKGEALSEEPIVLDPPLVTDRVEIGGDRPEGPATRPAHHAPLPTLDVATALEHRTVMSGTGYTSESDGAEVGRPSDGASSSPPPSLGRVVGAAADSLSLRSTTSKRTAWRSRAILAWDKEVNPRGSSLAILARLGRSRRPVACGIA